MKNNLILGVQGFKRLFKSIFIVVTLFVVGSVCARSVGEQAAQRPTTTTTAIQQQAAAEEAAAETAERSQPTVTQQETQETTLPRVPVIPLTQLAAQPTPSAPLTSPRGIPSQSIQIVLNTPYPWTQEMSVWVRNNWNEMTQEQRDIINADYHKKEMVYRLQYQQQYGYAPAPAAQPWTFEGALSGASERIKAALYYGGRKMSEGFGAAKARVSQTFSAIFGNYGSSIGTGYKLAAGFGAMAMAPYLGVAAAATYLSAGAATFVGGALLGVGAYGLMSVADRLETAYNTGYISENDAVDGLKGALEIVLNDKAVYPTFTTAVEALRDQYELRGLRKDKFGFIQKAHDSLIKAYKDAYSRADNEIKTWELNVFNNVRKLRTDHLSSSNDLRAYANSIGTEHNLALYHAALSEYYRAKKKAAALDGPVEQTTTQEPSQPQESTQEQQQKSWSWADYLPKQMGG